MNARIVACLLAVCAVSGASVSHASVPFMAWSGRNFFSGQSVASGSVSQSEVRSLVAQIVAPHANAGSRFVAASAPAAPEMLLAFVYAEMSSSAASREAGAYSSSTPNKAFAYAKNELTGSVSSLSAGSVSIDTPLSDDLIDTVATHFPAAQLFSAHIESQQDCATLMATLAKEPAVYSNGIPDLVLVHLDNVDRNDKCVQQLSEAVKKQSNGNFIALISADSAVARPLQLVFEEAQSAVSPSVFLATGNRRFTTFSAVDMSNITTTNTTALVGVTMVNSSAITGLLLALILIFILFCGVTCVSSIETPPRFASQPLQLSKEY